MFRSSKIGLKIACILIGLGHIWAQEASPDVPPTDTYIVEISGISYAYDISSDYDALREQYIQLLEVYAEAETDLEKYIQVYGAFSEEFDDSIDDINDILDDGEVEHGTTKTDTEVIHNSDGSDGKVDNSGKTMFGNEYSLSIGFGTSVLFTGGNIIGFPIVVGMDKFSFMVIPEIENSINFSTESTDSSLQIFIGAMWKLW